MPPISEGQNIGQDLPEFIDLSLEDIRDRQRANLEAVMANSAAGKSPEYSVIHRLTSELTPLLAKDDTPEELKKQADSQSEIDELTSQIENDPNYGNFMSLLEEGARLQEETWALRNAELRVPV